MNRFSIGIIANLKHKDTKTIIKKISKWLKIRKINFWIEKETADLINMQEKALPREILAKKTDLILSLGGDGTLLSIAEHAALNNKPIMAINLGSLGFLTEIKLSELFNSLNSAINNNYLIESRMMLQCIILRKNKQIQKYYALNDIVISREMISRLIQIEAYIDQEYVTTYNADGLIIATPTGSTAYSLSAGGPIVHPKIKALILSPICPHTLTNRPLIIAPSSEITTILKSVGQKVILTVDGQKIFHLLPDDIVKFNQARIYVKLIVSKNRNYFEVLRDKLNWGSRASK